MHATPAAPPADLAARERLIEAAWEVFGTCNLEGATTRQLAERAGVNQAAIPYYFGGKEGLYRAAVESVVAHMRERMLPTVTEMRRDNAAADTFTPARAVEFMKTVMGKFVHVLLETQSAATWARIVMREQMQPTAAFDLIYEGTVRHVHEALARAIAVVLRRNPEDPFVLLKTQTLMGQLLIFLAGRETARRRLGWTCYTPAEAQQVEAVLLDNIELLFGGNRRGMRKTPANAARKTSPRRRKS